ncbi:hypothetical protein D3C87_879090 [compost metagenome]
MITEMTVRARMTSLVRCEIKESCVSLRASMMPFWSSRDSQTRAIWSPMSEK